MEHESKIKPEDIKVDADVDTPPEGYTDEEWEDLSDAEKAGILESIREPEGEEIPDEKNLTKDDERALAVIAGETEDEGDDKPKVDEKPIEKKSDEKNPPEKKTDEETNEITDEALLAFKPTVSMSEISIEEVISTENKTKLDELDVKFDAGDITQKEYNTARDKINRDIIRDNDAVIDQAKEDAAWKKEQIFFLNAKPEYMASKTEDSSEKIKRNALFGALTEMVKTITADPKNSNLTGMQVLVQADKAVKEAFGIKKAAKEAVSEEEKPKEKKPPVKLPEIKTLSDIPAAADNNSGVDDSFAQIDKLTGEAYEEALERMSPAVREAYLNRA